MPKVTCSSRIEAWLVESWFNCGSEWHGIIAFEEILVYSAIVRISADNWNL